MLLNNENVYYNSLPTTTATGVFQSKYGTTVYHLGAPQYSQEEMQRKTEATGRTIVESTVALVKHSFTTRVNKRNQ
jgi:hypothetical protein